MINCLSWWEGHQSRLINEESHRPVLALSGLKPILATLPDDRRERLHIRLILKNVGRVTTAINEASFVPTLKTSSSTCQLYSIDIKGNDSPKKRETVEIAPGIEESLVREIEVSRTCESLLFETALSVQYLDPSGKHFTQDFYAPLFISLFELRKADDQTSPSARERNQR